MLLLPVEESTLDGYYNPQFVSYIFISKIVYENPVAGGKNYFSRQPTLYFVLLIIGRLLYIGVQRMFTCLLFPHLVPLMF